jgi:nucleotide-binding universal stress UspA family protein
MTLRLEGRSVSGDQFRAASARVLFTRGRFPFDVSVNLITMGTHGDQTTNMLDSTSQRVVTDSPVPVLTVKVSRE